MQLWKIVVEYSLWLIAENRRKRLHANRLLSPWLERILSMSIPIRPEDNSSKWSQSSKAHMLCSRFLTASSCTVMCDSRPCVMGKRIHGSTIKLDTWEFWCFLRMSDLKTGHIFSARKGGTKSKKWIRAWAFRIMLWSSLARMRHTGYLATEIWLLWKTRRRLTSNAASWEHNLPTLLSKWVHCRI